MPITYNTARNSPLYIFTATSGGTIFSGNLKDLTSFDLFSDSAVVDDAIYFSSNSTELLPLSNIYLTIGTAIVGTGITFVWEYWCSSTNNWRTCHNLTDGTRGFTNTGNVVVTVPAQANSFYRTVNGINQYWIRCRISTLTSISEGGATSTNLVRVSDGAINITGYTDMSPCSWNELYLWILSNAPEIGATKNGRIYNFDNFVRINISSTLRSTNEVVFFGNGCYYQALGFQYLWSGTKQGADGWSDSSYYFIVTMGPTNLFVFSSTTRIYGGSIIANGITKNVDGLQCFSGGFAGLANGDVIGVYAPLSGYFSSSENVNRCIVGGGLITDSKPTNYPTNLQISAPGTHIWSLYGNELDCENLTYAMPSSQLMNIGQTYQVGYNYNINIINPNQSFPEQTSVPRVVSRFMGSLINFHRVLFNDVSAGTFTDYTTAASDATANDVPLSGDVGDCLYFMPSTTYSNTSASNVRFEFTLPSQLNDYEYVVEYYKSSGGWTQIPEPLYFNTTENLTKSGHIYTCTGGNNYPNTSVTINGVSGIWFRIRIVTKGTTSPVASTIKCRLQSGAGTYRINEKYTTQLTVLTDDKTPIENASVIIKNKNNEIISLVTGVDGKTIATNTTVSETVFDPTEPDSNFNYVKNSLNPFTIEINKTGFETYTTTLDITEKFSQTFSLTPSKQVRQTIDGEVLLALKPELGSASLLTEI